MKYIWEFLIYRKFLAYFFLVVLFQVKINHYSVQSLWGSFWRLPILSLSLSVRFSPLHFSTVEMLTIVFSLISSLCFFNLRDHHNSICVLELLPIKSSVEFTSFCVLTLELSSAAFCFRSEHHCSKYFIWLSNCLNQLNISDTYYSILVKN